MTVSARVVDPNPESVVVRRTGLRINGEPEVVVEIETTGSHDYVAVQGSEHTVIETFRQAWNKLVAMDREYAITDPESEQLNEQLAAVKEARDRFWSEHPEAVGADRNPGEAF